MELKKIKVFTTVGIFALCFITHFLYDWFPSSFTAIFFPVNESIWEHLKMIYTTFFLGCFFEYLWIYKKKIEVKNYLFATFVGAGACILLYLIFYIPFYHSTPSLLIHLSLLFLTIFIAQNISYWIIQKRTIPDLFCFAVFLTIFSFIILGYLTYHPLHNDLFFDSQAQIYGFATYDI